MPRRRRSRRRANGTRAGRGMGASWWPEWMRRVPQSWGRAGNLASPAGHRQDPAAGWRPRPLTPDPCPYIPAMFPYKDENPTLSSPVVAVAIIAANALGWVLGQGMGAE